MHQKPQILTHVQSVRNVVRMRQRIRCELGVKLHSYERPRRLSSHIPPTTFIVILFSPESPYSSFEANPKLMTHTFCCVKLHTRGTELICSFGLNLPARSSRRSDVSGALMNMTAEISSFARSQSDGLIFNNYLHHQISHRLNPP